MYTFLMSFWSVMKLDMASIFMEVSASKRKCQ